MKTISLFNRFLKTALLFSVFTFHFSFFTNGQYTLSLEVTDSTFPDPSILNVGNIDEFVYVIKNNGGSLSKIKDIFFTVNPDADIAYYFYPPFTGNEYYLTYYNDSLINRYYTVYNYGNRISTTNSYPLVTGLSGNLIDSNAILRLTGQNYLGYGQRLVLHIPFQVINCSSTPGLNSFYIDTNGTHIDPIPQNTKVQVNDGIPKVSAAINVFDAASFCAAQGKDTAEIGFLIKDTIAGGSGPAGFARADSMRVYVYVQNNLATLSSFKVNGISVSGVTFPYSIPGYNMYLIDLTQYHAGTLGHPFGYNTVCDMSGNGFADQLPEDSVFELTATIQYITGCPPYGQPITDWQLPTVAVTYNNQCDTMKYLYNKKNIPDSLKVLAYYNYSETTNPSTISVPADITESANEFNAYICPQYNQTWSPIGFTFDCPNPDYEIIVKPSIGYHLNISSPMLRDSLHQNIFNVRTDIYVYTIPVTASPIGSCNGTIDSLLPSPITAQEYFTPHDSIVFNFGKMPISSNCGNEYTAAYKLACVNIPMILNCGDFKDTNIYTNETDTISYAYLFICDTNGCAHCGDSLSSQFTNTLHHCDGTCNSVPNTLQGWTIERTTLGYVNQNFPTYYSTCGSTNLTPANQIPLYDTAKINRGMAYPGDEVDLEIDGDYDSLYSYLDSNEFVQIFYPRLPNSPQPVVFGLDPVDSSYFVIEHCSITILNGKHLHILTMDTNMGPPVKLSFSLKEAIRNTVSPAIYNAWLNDRDTELISIAAHIHLRVLNGPNYYSYPQFLGQPQNLLHFRGEYMATTVGGDTILSCDSWGNNNFTILQPVISANLSAQPISTCDSFPVTLKFKCVGGLYSIEQDDYPFEFRPFAELSNAVTLSVPAGYIYTSSSFTSDIDNYDASLTDSTNHFAGGCSSQIFLVTPVIIHNADSTTTLKFVGLNLSNPCWPLMDEKYSGSSFPPLSILTIWCRPECNAPSPDTFFCQASFTVGTQQFNTTYQAVYTNPSNQQIITHTNPVVGIDGPNPQSNYSNLITFGFKLCDVNSYDVTDGWVAFENIFGYSLHVTTATLYDYTNGAYITSYPYYNHPDSGVVYNVGEIMVSACDSFIFSAYIDSTSRSCPPPNGGDTGKMVVRYGNLCSGTLINPDSTHCQNNVDTFYYFTYPTTLDLTNSGYSPDTVSLCDGLLTDSLSISSLNLGTIADPTFWVNIQPGITVDSVKYSYPCGAPYINFIKHDTFSLSAFGTIRAYGWILNRDLNMAGLPGTLRLKPGNDTSNTICVKVYLKFNCGFTNKDSITFTAQGISTCNIKLTADTSIFPAVNSSCCKSCKLTVGFQKDTIFCGGDSGWANAGASGGISPYTYSWSNGQTTQGISDLTAGSYTVFVIDSIGCTGEDSLTVTKCNPLLACLRDTAHYDDTIINTSAKALHVYGYTCKNILIIGTYTVDTNVTLATCNVAFAPYAMINIIKNSTLSILQAPYCSSTKYNHLYAACDTFWRGVFINPGSQLIVAKQVLIEDADSAVVAMNSIVAQGVYNMEGQIIFNKNYKSIVVEQCNGTYSGQCQSCLFTCRNFSNVPSCTCYWIWDTLPVDTCLFPWHKPYSYMGYDIKDVQLMEITNNDVFDNLQYGIRGLQSDLHITNEVFQNIGFRAGYGAGVADTGFNTVIYTLAVDTNTFISCYNGIIANKGLDEVTIEADTIYDSIKSPGAFGVCVSDMTPTRRVRHNTLNVQENTITNFLTGIEADMNTIVTGNINYNTVSENICSPVIWKGISLNELFTSSRDYYTVDENIINTNSYGITSVGVHRSIINDNTITLGTIGCPDTTGAGIALKSDGNSAQIGCNTITTPVSSNSYTGIVESQSQFDTVINNTTDSTNIHIRFNGVPYSGDNLWTDSLTTGVSPSVIGILTSSGALYGANMGEPLDGTNNNFITYFACRTDLDGVTYYYSTLTYEPTPSCSFPPFAIPGSFPLSHPCQTPPLPPSMERSHSLITHNNDSLIIDSATIVLMENTALSKIIFPELQDTNIVLAKEGLINILWQYPYLLNNSVFKKFNDSMSAAPMGRVLAIDTTMVSTDSTINYPSLLTSLNAIIPSNNIEDNLQTASIGYINYIINGTLSQNELATLRTLANKCPDWDGNGVYMARGVLSLFDPAGTDYSDSCSSNHQTHKSEKKNEINNTIEPSFSLYPNPNNGSFTIEYQLAAGQTGNVILFNTLGETVGEYDLSSSSEKMNITNYNLNNGVYVYKLYTNNSVEKVGKIIIIK